MTMTLNVHDPIKAEPRQFDNFTVLKIETTEGDTVTLFCALGAFQKLTEAAAILNGCFPLIAPGAPHEPPAAGPADPSTEALLP